MKISRLMKLIELDGTEAPQVRNPKEVKVSPNAPLLQSKDKHPMILQSEKPEEEIEEQNINLMSTYSKEPLEKGRTINPPEGTVAHRLMSKYRQILVQTKNVIEPKVRSTSLRLAPAEEGILIPYILEDKKKQKSSMEDILGMIGILTIAAIISGVASYFEAKEKRDCFSKTGKEGFECRKRLKLKEIETQIAYLRKRLQKCYTKVSREHDVLMRYCIDTTGEKILDLRDKFREEMSKKYKGSK